MLYHKDFEPELVKKNTWTMNEYESIEQIMARINEFIRYEQVIVVNVETIFFPEATKSKKERKLVNYSSFSHHSYITQVIRVWYRK